MSTKYPPLPKALPLPVLRELAAAVGEANVVWRPQDLLVYEYDATIGRAMPSVVVLPASAEEVAACVRVAGRHGLPVVPRGAGTGLSGGALAVHGGVVVSTMRMNRILEVNAEERFAVVEPGLVNLRLTEAAARHGLFYAPDPSSQKACTIGGNVAENSGGPHCLALGTTTNHVLGLECVLADGAIVRLGGWGVERPGYDLTGLVVGSEGTLCIVTKVCVRLLPVPEAVTTLLAVFDTIDQATEVVSEVIASGLLPAALEMIDKYVIRAVEPVLHIGFPLDAEAVLLIEVDGLREAVDEDARVAEAICREHGAREVRAAERPEERARLWQGRKESIGALGRLAPNYYILDGVVPRSKLPEVLRRVYEVSERYGFLCANVFHAGDGNLHPNLMFDEREPGATERVLECGGEILRLCVEAGGAISGEHGVGHEKRDYMRWIYGEDDLSAMELLKEVFGATDRFNPCKILPTGHGCGETQQSTIERLGPGAWV